MNTDYKALRRFQMICALLAYLSVIGGVVVILAKLVPMRPQDVPSALPTFIAYAISAIMGYLVFSALADAIDALFELVHRSRK